MRRRSGRAGWRIVVSALVLCLAVVVAACGSSSNSSSSSSAATSGGAAKKGNYTIALSNSFLGNTWRQTMVRIFQNTAKQAQSQGLIKSYKVENAANGTATEQIAQLKSLILQHVNAILIDAASADALNPTIKQACNAGITVVVFDSLATEPCAYKLEDSIAAYGFQEGNFVGQKMGGKGNLLMVRGVVGSAPEKVIYDNQIKALKKYPGIKIVRSLVGQASNSVTQQAVAGALPSLPPVQGVVTGGSSLGAVQAFQSAHKPIPVVAFDNSGEALRFWAKQHQKNGYSAVSVRTEPGQAAVAFWMAMDILQGKKIPNKIYTFPNVVIKQSDLDKWMQATPNGSVAAFNWTRPLVEQGIQAQESGQPVQTPSIPTSPPGA
jgi:ribose transport system substrate-binding protein